MDQIEKIRQITNMVRSLVYTIEQVTNGSDNWRVNFNMRSTIEDLKYYMDKNPD